MPSPEKNKPSAAATTTKPAAKKATAKKAAPKKAAAKKAAPKKATPVVELSDDGEVAAVVLEPALDSALDDTLDGGDVLDAEVVGDVALDDAPEEAVEPDVLDAAAALDPVLDPVLDDPYATDDDLLADGEVDLEDGGPVVDVDAGPGLVRSARIPLPRGEGEWVRGDVDKDSGSAGGGDRIYRTFVREATRVQRLSDDEERVLGRRVRDHGDKEAAKKLVVHNLRLVIKMAHQYRRAWTNLMDLIQEASAGMAIASQRWDPDQGTKFGTYAVYWIRAQLTKFLMTNGRAIHTGNTRAGRKLYFQLPRVRRKLLAEGTEPTIEAIAKEVQEDPLEVARVVARLDGREASLDAQLGDDDGATLGDTLHADEEYNPEGRAARQEVGATISAIMLRFKQSLEDERDIAIWNEHLIAQDPKSLVELGARFGVSKQRMGQLATRLKRAFRRHVIDELGPNTQLSWLFSQD